MNNPENFIRKLIELMGFDDYTLEIDVEHKHGIIFIHNHPRLIKENLPALVECINHLVQLTAKKQNQAPIFFDINNYRRERENLIVELARAAARKAVATRQEISLPAMNSYERRLVHLELATRPDVVTESTGHSRSRYVVIKPIGENPQGEEKTEKRDSASPAVAAASEN